MKKKILLSSIAVIALCLCLIAGSTYALFTTETEVNIAVTAGKLGVKANIVKDSMQLRSLEDDPDTFPRAGTFSNGGTVRLKDGNLKISKMTPGDAVYFQVKVANTGDVAVAYKVTAIANPVAEGKNLADVLKVTVVGEDGKEFTNADSYQALGAPKSSTTFTVIVEFVNSTPEHDNPYQGATADITFNVEAVQQNGVDANGNLIID